MEPAAKAQPRTKSHPASASVEEAAEMSHGLNAFLQERVSTLAEPSEGAPPPIRQPAGGGFVGGGLPNCGARKHRIEGSPQ